MSELVHRIDETIVFCQIRLFILFHHLNEAYISSLKHAVGRFSFSKIINEDYSTCIKKWRNGNVFTFFGADSAFSVCCFEFLFVFGVEPWSWIDAKTCFITANHRHRHTLDLHIPLYKQTRRPSWAWLSQVQIVNTFWNAYHIC